MSEYLMCVKKINKITKETKKELHNFIHIIYNDRNIFGFSRTSEQNNQFYQVHYRTYRCMHICRFFFIISQYIIMNENYIVTDSRTRKKQINESTIIILYIYI
uniref:Uncharacterized protein n=1 Tax=Schizaphis graminum TaxID=13262 RepID=A0A2S2NX83_SCHGA